MAESEMPDGLTVEKIREIRKLMREQDQRNELLVRLRRFGGYRQKRRWHHRGKLLRITRY